MPLLKNGSPTSENSPNVREWKTPESNEALAPGQSPQDALRCPSACDVGNSTRLLAG